MISKIRCSVVLIWILFLSINYQAKSNILSAEQQDEMIIVRIDDVTFTCYRYGDGQKYPYFYPVNGPASGLSVTTESSLPYPHHRSLWFGCDKVNGGNYWQEGNDRGQIISKGPTIISNEAKFIHIRDESVWKQPNEDPIISDIRNIKITAPSNNIRIIDFEITLTTLTDVKIQKTNHSLFSARMHPNLSVKSGGTLINSEGKLNEENTAGIASAWCDYYGSRYGIVEGLAIFDSPNNPWYPSRWFTRDYGFISPTILNWLEQDISSKEGDSVKFEYRVIVHSGDTKDANIEKLFVDWRAERIN